MMGASINRRVRAQWRRRRRGSEVLEAALIFPILLALAFGTVELGYYFYVEHNVEGAAREGARAACVASLHNSTNERADAAETAIDEVMAQSGFSDTNAYNWSMVHDTSNTYITVGIEFDWNSVPQGLRPLGLVRNTTVRANATMMLEQ
jgi:Flp pilus assembly protein TadG